jgi:hypothetical protein
MSRTVQILGWSTLAASFGISALLAVYLHSRQIGAIQSTGSIAAYAYCSLLVALAVVSVVAAVRRERAIAAAGFRWVIWAQVSFLAQAVCGFVFIQQFIVR